MRAKSFLLLALAFLIGALGGAVLAPEMNVGKSASLVLPKPTSSGSHCAMRVR